MALVASAESCHELMAGFSCRMSVEARSSEHTVSTSSRAAAWGQPPGCVCSQDEISWDCVRAECRSIPEGSAAASQCVPVGVV